jgi:hypothetical protein
VEFERKIYFCPNLAKSTFSQIWLNPFVNDCQSTYVTNLAKKKNPWLLSTLKTTLISGEGLV